MTLIYKLYTNNGDRLSIEADSIQSDGSGTRLFKEGSGLIASFWPGEITRVFPEDSLEEAEIITEQ